MILRKLGSKKARNSLSSFTKGLAAENRAAEAYDF